MNKVCFLSALRDQLRGLPQDEIEERVRFYNEMIEDRIEDGLSEEDAVAAVGTVDEVALQIVDDIPLIKVVELRRRLKPWEIVLLILGSPVWLSLLIAAVAVVFALYVSLWSAIVSLWAVFASLIGCAIGGIVGGIGFALGDNLYTGLALAAAGIVCAGLSVFAFYGCKAITNGMVLLTRKTARSIKHRLLKGREHHA